MPALKYTKEVLEPIVAEARSYREVLVALNLRPSGGAHTNIKRWIQEYGLDVSHFKHRAWNRGNYTLTAEEVLVVEEPLRKRAARPVLLRLMREAGVPYECQLCGQGDLWQGQTLTLPIDHISGEAWDNRLENLRFLCPNCHSLQPTNRAWRHTEKSPPKRCECGVEIRRRSTRCSTCANRATAARRRPQGRANWPSDGDLVRLLEQAESHTAVAREIGVSTTAIRNRLRNRGIPVPKSKYRHPEAR